MSLVLLLGRARKFGGFLLDRQILGNDRCIKVDYRSANQSFQISHP